MIEDWIVVTTGVVAIVIALCLSYIYSEGREISLIRNRQKLKVYEDLFHAITDLNVAADDPYARDRAKMRLAHTLNRLNLVAGPGVLKHVNELLDFFNEYGDEDVDVLKQTEYPEQHHSGCAAGARPPHRTETGGCTVPVPVLFTPQGVIFFRGSPGEWSQS